MSLRFVLHVSAGAPSAALLGMLLMSAPRAAAASFSDNFDDQSDSAWTEYNPLGVGSYTFPEVTSGDYAYNISAAAQSPTMLLETETPSFAASFYTGQTFTHFYESVDVLNWEMNPNDPSEPLDQAVGLLARMTLNAGYPDGYGLTLSTHSNQILLSTIVNGAGTVIDTIPVTLDSSDEYQLEFDGSGSSLSGTLTDLTDLSQLPAGESTGAGATFDNYSISDVPEPASLATLGFALLVPTLRRRRSRA